MIVQILLVGVNHNTAPLAVRERLAFGKADAGLAARRLLESEGVREAVVLSTCNRTEIYAALDRPERTPLVRLLLDCGISEKELAGCLFVQQGDAAVHHLHRVAAGLDSMVLGEAQILGQVKESLALAQEAGTVGATLDRLFRSATTAGKRVRTETGLARGAVSISHAAVELAKRIFGDLRGLSAMILGAGEMSKVAARLLADAGVASILVANRTYERAVGLAEGLGGKAVRFDEFPGHVARADVIICSTAAPHPVVRLDAMRPLVAARRGRPLFLIDIAVPRDVEPEVGDLDGVFLFTIDDLQAVVRENLAERAGEIAASEAIVREETGHFLQWLRSASAGPLLAALQQKGELVVQGELAKIRGRLQHLSERDWQLVEVVARGVAKRLLRDPILAVKRLAAEEDARHPLDVARELFELSPTPVGREGEQ
ncbi:MAG: glutamyl-tRNA reductase [Armatimonadetes bacterium]|nr:glutamyl-tRNA reductase [Armatimonadota bacterium]